MIVGYPYEIFCQGRCTGPIHDYGYLYSGLIFLVFGLILLAWSFLARDKMEK